MTDLGFDIHLTGRAAKPLSAEVVRELVQSDLALLATERGVKPSHIQSITDRHHALARCLSTGMTVFEACQVTGYTPSRVSVLRGDPAFEELVAHYRDIGAEATYDYQRKAAIARNVATDLALDKMTDSPEELSFDQRLDAVKLFSAMTGQGPQAKTQATVNVNLSMGDRMKAARERAGQRNLPNSGADPEVSHDTSGSLVIDGTFTEVK